MSRIDILKANSELIWIQIAFLGLMALIIWKTLKAKRNPTFHWTIFGAYALIIGFVLYDFLTTPIVIGGGNGLALGMFSTFIPPILLLISSIKYLYGGHLQKGA